MHSYPASNVVNLIQQQLPGLKVSIRLSHFNYKLSRNVFMQWQLLC